MEMMRLSCFYHRPRSSHRVSSTEFTTEFNRGILRKAQLCVLGAQAPSSKQKVCTSIKTLLNSVVYFAFSVVKPAQSVLSKEAMPLSKRSF
jgi:hypothetical protein